MAREFTDEELKKQAKSDAMLAFNKADPKALFDFIQEQATWHLVNQREKLLALQKTADFAATLKPELQACIQAYELALADIQNRKYEHASAGKVLQGIGGVTAFVGGSITGISMGVGVLVGAPLAALGISVMGVGSAFSAKFDTSSQDSMMRPVFKAEEKAISFLKKHKNNDEVKKLLPKFKTESKNFKKRMFLLGFGVLCIAVAVIALGMIAGSHGALAPLAFVAHKLVIIGGHHVAAAVSGKAVSSTKIAGLAATGIASITMGVMFPGKRVAVEDAKEPSKTVLDGIPSTSK